ncbi:MAG: hypothetical protein K9K75_04870 [Deltaproteobacteria bacterium]|nr:hypothetical protein [Deltaproteobacteria bacterium]
MDMNKSLAQLVHQTPTEEKAPRLKKIAETFQTPLDSPLDPALVKTGAGMTVGSKEVQLCKSLLICV